MSVPADQVAAAQALWNALDSIIAGNRDPALADDPALDPIVAAELQLLLECMPTPA